MNHIWLPLMPSLGPLYLARGMRYAEASATCLRVFRKVSNMSQDRPFMEKPLERVWVGLKIGWGGVFRELPGQSEQ